MSISRRLDEQNAVHPQNGILFSRKKERITTPAALWANLQSTENKEGRPDWPRACDSIV